MQPTESTNEMQEKTQQSYQEEDATLTKKQKQRILSILFGRLLRMHRSIMIALTVVHSIIIFLVCFHMFTLGTIESENKYCYLTWPLMHLFYAFVNYIFAWFCCYNSCEIANKRGQNLLQVSKKFLRIFFIFTLTPIPLKYLTGYYCRIWTISWESVVRETAHILIETVALYIYFSWFERKYTGFRIFYKESVFQLIQVY